MKTTKTSSPTLLVSASHTVPLLTTYIVVIDADGTYLGKHRKNHIPRVGDFNEVLHHH